MLRVVKSFFRWERAVVAGFKKWGCGKMRGLTHVSVARVAINIGALIGVESVKKETAAKTEI